jgi:hypothetical protein
MKERFEQKYIKVPSGCWEWQACSHERGYGYFYTSKEYSKRKMDFAHKVSLFLYKGIKTGSKEHVMHICDNPKCVNPDHLKVGTHKDNMRDMAEKGRAGGPKKINEKDIKNIRELRKKGYQIKQIAEKYNLDRGYTSRLCKGCLPYKYKPKNIGDFKL